MLRKSSEAKNLACNAIVDRIDQGSLYPYGSLYIYDLDSTTITSLRLTYPAFADATDGTATANFIYDNTAFVDGTASTFDFYARDGSWVWGGGVSLAGQGGEMELSSLFIPQDTTVSITTARYIVP